MSWDLLRDITKDPSSYFNRIENLLGDNFHNDLLEIKHKIKLDKTIFGYFNRCFQMNEVFTKYNFFLKFLNNEIYLGS